MNKVYAADPFILKDPHSDLYYCYCTNGDEEPFGTYVSSDWLNWKPLNPCLKKGSWAKDWFWAPEVYFNPNNGYYYMFYSARVRKDLTAQYFGRDDFVECAKIGVAVSKDPAGPFVDIENRPIDYYPYDTTPATEGYVPSIDANLLFDDGHIYLYFSRCCYGNKRYDPKEKLYIEESQILGVELDPSFWKAKVPVMPEILEEEKGYDSEGKRRDYFRTLISYAEDPQPWENADIHDFEESGGTKPDRRWAEGSTAMALKDSTGQKHYAMTYSCNNFEGVYYGVGIAFAENPLGPYRKFAKNPILSTESYVPVCSTGHGSWVKRDDQYYYFFHGRTQLQDPRSLFFGKINLTQKDDIRIMNIRPCYLKDA